MAGPYGYERGISLADTAITLVGVRKAYGSRIALDDVTWTAEAGKVHGIIGANGSGKTTLLKILAGLAVFDEGRASVLGMDLIRRRHRIAPGIGIALEGMSLLPQFTGRDNLRLLASLRGPVDMIEIDETLARLGLEPRDHRLVRAYSLGMRQRLNLAQAVLGRPRLLLWDEPTNGLDPDGAASLLAMMAEPSDVTIVMASHRVDEVAEVCDFVWEMKDGRLSALAPASKPSERRQP